MPTPGVDDGGSSIGPTAPFGDLNSIIDLIKNIGGSQSNTNGNSSTTLGGDASAVLQQLLAALLPDIAKNDYSPEAATRDAQGIIDKIMMDYKQTSLPAVYKAQNASGGYNSTTGQLLANDAFARASVLGGEAVTKNIETYGKLRQGQVSQLLQLVLGLAAVNKNTTNNSQTTQGKVPNDALKAAAAAAALSKLTSGKKSGTNSQAGSLPNDQPTGDILKPGDQPDSPLAAGETDPTIQGLVDALTGQDQVGLNSDGNQNFADQIPDINYGDPGNLQEDLGGQLSADNPYSDISTGFDFNEIFQNLGNDNLDNQDTPDFSFPDGGSPGFDFGSDTEQDF